MIAQVTVRNALDDRLGSLQQQRRLALTMYLTAGYPDAETTVRWASLLDRAGAAIIELGVPFSDPLGDGPTVQHASQKALEGGMSLARSLELAARISNSVTAPIVLMSYCNPVFRMGGADFARRAALAGVSGVIVPDLPIEEAGPLAEELAAAGIHLIYMLSPTSTDERVARTARAASGFIYCMAVTGITGARADLSAGLSGFLARVREQTNVPLIVGFGVSRPSHISTLSTIADGAVVASALIDLIDRTPTGERDAAIAAYVEELSASCSVS